MREEDGHDFDMDDLALGDFCITLEARLFDVDGNGPSGPRHARGYIDGTDAGADFFDGSAPHGFVTAVNVAD